MGNQPNTFYSTKDTSLTDLINEHVGAMGRMIGPSKSMYRHDNPGNVVFFNACVYDETGVQVWWGDVDVTLDKSKFEKVASIYKDTFYLTRESYRSDFNPATIEELRDDNQIIVFNGRKNEAQG